MYIWEKLFDSVALARAKAIDSSRITLTKKDETHIDAAVLSMGRVEVSITFKDGAPVIMKCKCPKARSGRKCEHMAAVLFQLEREKAPKKATERQPAPTKKEPAAEKHSVSPEAPTAEEQGAMDLNGLQKLWETAVTSRAEEKTESKEPPEKEGTHGTETGAAVTKKRGRKSKAQLEAERIAAEEAAKQAKKEETERRIAERKALKSAQKAERRRKRQEAEEAQQRARAEETARKEEEQRRQQEEALRRELEEKKRREADLL